MIICLSISQTNGLWVWVSFIVLTPRPARPASPTLRTGSGCSCRGGPLRSPRTPWGRPRASPVRRARAQHTGAESKVKPLKGFSPALTGFSFCVFDWFEQVFTAFRRFSPISLFAPGLFAPVCWAPRVANRLGIYRTWQERILETYCFRLVA